MGTVRTTAHTDASLMGKCEKDELFMADLALRVESGESNRSIADNLGVPQRIINTLVLGMRKPYGEVVDAASATELQAESEVQARRAQKFMDKNRVQNAAFRAGARYYNAVEELTAEMIQLLSAYRFGTPSKARKRNPAGDKVGIIQLSDLHLNEVITANDTLGTNEFNYDVAAKRLRKYADAAIDHLKHRGVDSVLVAITGDVLNSDRRLDELLCNAGNRSKALVVAVDLLQQFLRQLSEHFHVCVLSICGNESRKDIEIGSTSKAFTHNYDYDVHMMLQAMFDANGRDVSFLPITDSYEMVVDILGHGILFVHGHQYEGGGRVQDIVAKDVAKFARAGKSVNYTIFGHIHCTHISDSFARSGSLPGANAYSGHKLLVSSRASQNIFVVDADGINAVPIDLQNCAGCDGYSYHKELVSGSGMRKSVDKARDTTTVFKLVI